MSMSQAAATLKDLFISLTRDCQGVYIPSGMPADLKQGTKIVILHDLGNDYTIETEEGYWVRIDGQDADALGLELKSFDEILPGFSQLAIEEQVQQVLRTCYDPEIPVNIMDLGLIYDTEVFPIDSPKDPAYRVEILMTLTAPGCGMGDVLKNDVQRKLKRIPSIQVVNVNLTFDPPWDMSRMSEAARIQLNLG